MKSDQGTLLVTGGAGFIGSNFVHLALEQTEASVVVLDKLTYAGSLENLADVSDHPRFVFVRGDIAERADVEAVFRAHRPTAVLNFAAESHVDRSIDDASDFIRTNIHGTWVLLEVSRHFLAHEAEDPQDFRFLHVSTDEVFGSLGPDGYFREDTPYAPNSPYAASKASADHLVRAYHHTHCLPTLVSNCSNNYGPYQFPEKLIPVMLLNALDGRELPIYGDGSNIRDWLHVADHCAGLLRVLQRGRPGESYNIGGNQERTNLEVLDTLCAVLEEFRPARDNEALSAAGVTSYPDLRRFVTDRPGHDQRYAIDAARMRDELDWAPQYDFESGIRDTVRWYLDHLDWCAAIERGQGRERLGLGSAQTAALGERTEEGS